MIGSQITSISITPDQIIPTNTPSGLGYDLPSVWEPNLRFDGYIWKWTDSVNETLREGSVFGDYYDGDVEVQANWLKKVETVIWCGTDQTITEQAIEDLSPYVSVFSNTIPGREPGPGNYHCHAFFNDTVHPIFGVDHTEINTNGLHVVTIPGNGRQYTFLAWWRYEPTVFSSVSNNGVDSYYVQFTHPNEVSVLAPIGNDYLKQEWAAFISGVEVEVVVTTNVGSISSTYHNNHKIKFWYSRDTSNPYVDVSPFMDNPPSPNGTQSLILIPGDVFNFAIEDEAKVLQDPDWTHPSWVFRGWYIRSDNTSWDDPTQLPTSQFFPSDTWQLSLYSHRYTITAVYTQSTENNYTITYYKGLPDN